MAVVFLEPGTDATQDFSFYATLTNGGGTLSSDTTHAHTGVRSVKTSVAASADFSFFWPPDGTVADAGAVVSFWAYFSSTTPSSNIAICLTTTAGNNTNCLAIGLTTTGLLSAAPDSGGPGGAVNGTHALAANTWYRITVGYVVTSASSWSATVYLNGVSEIVVSNATHGDTIVTGSSDAVFGLGGSDAYPFGTASSLTVWYDDIYINNLATKADPGNVSVTNKRAVANGTTNGFTAVGTPSGYGSGHAAYVNGNYPVGSDTTTYVSVLVAGSAITEEYTIEGPSVGDANTTGATLVGVEGWVIASSSLAETDSIKVDGTSTNIAVTSTAKLFTAISPNPTTYPAGTGTDIGVVTNTAAATMKLFGAGVLLAFIPAAVAASLPYQPAYFLAPFQGY